MDYPLYPGSIPQRQTWLPQPQMQMQMPMQQPPGFNCRPVTSREEAVATQVDFASPGTLMPDFAHNVIYFKRFNSNTGVSDFLTYALRTDPPPQPAPEWASVQEVGELRSMVNELAKRLEAMKREHEPVGSAATEDLP